MIFSTDSITLGYFGAYLAERFCWSHKSVSVLILILGLLLGGASQDSKSSIMHTNGVLVNLGEGVSVSGFTLWEESSRRYL
jgi:hypothetical protein